MNAFKLVKAFFKRLKAGVIALSLESNDIIPSYAFILTAGYD